MTKEFISYEEALALKELGFNESCFGNCKKTHKELEKAFYCYNSDYFDYSELYIAAPLYQQAFRWFREKHNLFGQVNIHTYFIYDISNDEFNSAKQYDKSTKNYEEAELECLKKLIEIVKNK
jgi:hypothetical protein